MQNKQVKGFTLIELLIVIGIIAILATVVILTLNPAELLRQARDTTRISDLDTLRSALSLYLADVAPIDLGVTTTCYTSIEDGTDITAMQAVGVVEDCANRFSGTTVIALIVDSGATARQVNGTGWIPVDLTDISSGAPISALPVDPVQPNTPGADQTVITDDFFYAYGADSTDGTFEINTRLESAKFADNDANDGGDNDDLYEVGTNPGLDF